VGDICTLNYIKTLEAFDDQAVQESDNGPSIATPPVGWDKISALLAQQQEE
jgi:hypothetical protein